MSDNEIIKAWRCCCGPSCNCKECPMKGINGCWVALKYETLNLINDQKAELEMMRNYIHDNNLEYDFLSYFKRNGGWTE